MSNRLLREGICTSDSINELTPEEEVLFYRVLVVSDDYGHMDGRPAILKAQCFPLKDTATVARIETWVAGLVRKSMLACYTIEGRSFLAVAKWENRIRSKPKYPTPTDADWCSLSAGCAHVADNPPQDADDCEQFAARAGPRNARRGLGLGLGKGLGASSNVAVAFDAKRGQFSIPELLRSQWQGAYPALSLDAEIAKASVWLLSNPKNAKSNYARFLTNWLQRAQDSAPRAGPSPKADPFAGAR